MDKKDMVQTHGRTPPPELGAPPATVNPEPQGHPGKVEVFEDEKGDFRFRVKGGNGEIIVTSEGYTRKHDATRGFATLIDIINHPDTSEEDQTDGE